jgi:tRNA G10  N-methylase Trm11
MRYFFIPGRERDLSSAELREAANAFFDSCRVSCKGREFFTIKTDSEPKKVHHFFHKLGGFIKYGPLYPIDKPIEDVINIEERDKVLYAISGYSNGEELDNELINGFSKQVENYLDSKSIKSRYIKGRNNQVSSGQILGNQLLDKGFELSILRMHNGKEYIGKTYDIQDIEDFTFRDQEKPHIDTEMGMLPPKLARIMLNLTGLEQDSKIWDPFCGVGTVLLEGLIMGYDMIGSDVSLKMVDASEGNIAWLAQNYKLKDREYNVFQYDVHDYDEELFDTLKATELDGVVFEPYMGPPQTRVLKVKKAENLIVNLNNLLNPIFKTLERVGRDGLKVVFVLPSYKTFEGWVTLRYSYFLSKKWRVLNNEMREKNLHWKRSNSIIRRDIVVLELKK